MGNRQLTNSPIHQLILAVLAFLAYSNSFTAGFSLDSRALILQDPRVHAATSENVSLIVDRTYWWPYGESGLYRPLTTFSYLFNYAILGNADRPLGYHIVNLALHTINVLLVFSIRQIRLDIDRQRPLCSRQAGTMTRPWPCSSDR